ncbi:ABC transporter permease [Parabacteroides sp. PF5-6]|uniref:ABC transporter permease n=1 Tax=Parabacteroides sp. PF5-6 TaxID=1742403 RepID=UPI0024067CED|nr:ABC transporter permease [Parabacteroides sp. PF5-6]MDF9831051.1 putative ABC transport system permease protein [Parabacteroides sp. PF5-6]
MYKQYFKQALASLRENPLVSFLTILGTALSVAMMMVLVWVYQVKTSSFAPVSERHRMLYVNIIEGINEQGSGYRGGALGVRMVKECFYSLTTPETVTAVGTNVRQKRISVAGNKFVREGDVREVDHHFWDVFDFRFLNGSPLTEAIFASAIPAAVITEDVARQFFGTTEVVGQTLQLDFVEYTIQGVVHPVSEAVGEAYGEIWIPYSVNKALMNGDAVEGIGGQLRVCILARSSADFAKVRQEVNSRIETFNSGQKEFFANIWGQPLTSTQLMFTFIQGERMSGTFSGMLSLAALFLLLPVFNLLGIIISQIRKRRPEIGLRKAFGATAQTVTGQILAENLVVTLIGSAIGFCLSLAFFYIAKGSLLERPDVDLQLNMIIQPALLLVVVVLSLLINLLSTGIPAWQASRAQATDSLNATN